MPLVAAWLALLLVNALRSVVSWKRNGRTMRRAVAERRALLPESPPRPRDCVPGEQVALLGRFRVDRGVAPVRGSPPGWQELGACSRELDGVHRLSVGERPRLQVGDETVAMIDGGDSRLALGTMVARLLEKDPATYNGLRDGDAVWVVGRLEREPDGSQRADYRSEPPVRHTLAGPWRLFALGTVKVRFKRLPISAVEVAAAVVAGLVATMGGWDLIW